MIIFGIDPGTATTGWGVVETCGQEVTCLGVGVIVTSAHDEMSKRLTTIYDDLCQLLAQFRPDAVAVEQLFFNTNAKTALSVGQARGVVMVAIEKAHVPFFSYTPLQIKMAIAGYGRADKKQVQTMVQKLLKLETLPKPDDAADGLAIALTHSYSYKLNENK